MDGADALRFRKVLPRAKIIALEPNPRNFALMEANEALRRGSIRIFPLAASDSTSTAPFFVVGPEYQGQRIPNLAGMSSLYRRSDGTDLESIVQVITVRLDELLARERLCEGNIALWIDAEGAAFEVIRGTEKSLGNVSLIHIEVESQPIIGKDQKLFADVESVLKKAGYSLLATSESRDHVQFNALFVRSDMLRTMRHRVRWWCGAARARRLVGRSILSKAPSRLRRIIERFAH